MENVFGGVRISPDDEMRGRAGKADLRARPWLSGLTMSAVRVRLTRDDDEDEKEGTASRLGKFSPRHVPDHR